MHYENERIIGGAFIQEDAEIENSLRPKWMKDYIGQDRAKEKLNIFIKAAKTRRHRSQAAAIGADGDRPLDRQHCSWGGANAGARIHGCVGGTTL